MSNARGSTPTPVLRLTPYLRAHRYSESIAIMRYVARVGGMYPTEAEAALAADMAADYAADLRSRLVRIRFGPEEKKASSLEELMKKFPTRVDKLFARKSPRSKFFGGGSPGFPDPAVYSLALEAELHDVLTDLPALAQFKADFEAIPAVAEYQKAAAERWPPAPPAKAAASTSKPITQQPWFLPSIAVAAIGAGALIFAKSR